MQNSPTRNDADTPTAESAHLVKLLHRLATRLHPRHINVMEVCGTHTAAAQAAALPALLPENVRLISGPGCPVCVTPAAFIDQAAHLALQHHVHILTYGDMIRVPGQTTSLEEARRHGAQVSVVYSARQALQIAARKPDKNFVFLGIGFETTAPATAVALAAARQQHLTNFFVLSAHKRLMPAMQALCSDQALAIDAFIGPGHVSVIIGSHAYTDLVARYRRPCVIAGFTGQQMLLALVHILTQLLDNTPAVANVYGSRVSTEGNRRALDLIAQTFTPADTRWRGLGVIDQSGLALAAPWQTFDAAHAFQLPQPPDAEPPGCRCGDVIKGLIPPADCPLFARRCTPDHPIGACMVSREGTCTAWYRYRRSENHHA